MPQLSPMMHQYILLKEKYNDCLLFFRLGDFYEMFFEDAETASKELEIVLTGKDCGLAERAPMCGVPYHAVDSYINKLISRGYKVAICEQLTDPAESKGLVDRDVIRVITPGTVIEETILEKNKNNYIMSVCMRDGLGIAYADVSTGDFFVSEIKDKLVLTKLKEEIASIAPSEIIANEQLFLATNAFTGLINGEGIMINCYSGAAYEYENAREALLGHFKTASLDGYGIAGMENGVCAAGALISYLEETQKVSLGHINRIRAYQRESYMVLDGNTKRNLELTASLRDGGRKGTLLWLLDRAKTSMGSRLVRSWIEHPLQNIKEIEGRLESVAEIKEDYILSDELKKVLAGIYDIERLASRIAYATLDARNCISLKQSLQRLPAARSLLKECKSPLLVRIFSDFDAMEDIAALLEKAVQPDPPLSVKEGGIIRDGYNAEVDRLRKASREGKEWISQLEQKEREVTGIKNLRISFNKVFGYYIEVTKSNYDMVPYRYIRKQTLTGAERYTTPELMELEKEMTGAQEKCMRLEYQLFCELREGLNKNILRLQKAAKSIALIDALQSLAAAASENDYARPKMSKGHCIRIQGGRHPVVERTLSSKQFIDNDTYLDNGENRMMIITGPNMAGKSTYMRQVGLIVLMAHIGSFVPAKSAEICITDRIFTRVGASDNLAFGQSTFMVEMSEVANILNSATNKSLLILDEIGRGTSTYDGMSIAWAVVEHVCDKEKLGAKALFATHYHELSELEGRIEGAKNYCVTVREIGDEIIFLRKVKRGGTDRSFGIEVARLAGIPENVIERAKSLLPKMQDRKHGEIFSDPQNGDANGAAVQLKLLTSNTDEIISELAGMDIQNLTPLNALLKLGELSDEAKRLKEGEKP
ncbi:MAG: DNA mismatch repair protein MutS [Bacillota bacterium]|nr:DNA mismatch repair protein MutS [Bacillota bacterium]